jgi:hypothetical protein
MTALWASDRRFNLHYLEARTILTNGGSIQFQLAAVTTKAERSSAASADIDKQCDGDQSGTDNEPRRSIVGKCFKDSKHTRARAQPGR